MANQCFILDYILTVFEKRLKSIDWCGLDVNINSESKKSDSVSLFIRVYDISPAIYENVNDKVRVGNKLIPRSLPVETHIVLFCCSENHNSQLKALGVLLQSIRDERKMDIGEYSWLNNDDRPLTVDSVNPPEMHLKLNIKNSFGFSDSIPLFFRVSSCIDSKLAEDFTEVKERKVQMVKMDD